MKLLHITLLSSFIFSILSSSTTWEKDPFLTTNLKNVEVKPSSSEQTEKFRITNECINDIYFNN